MKYIKLFEEFEKSFFSNRERKEFYKNLKANTPMQDRIYQVDQLGKFDIPDEIIENMKEWGVIYKSPFSDTFYNSTDIGVGHKPNGVLRVSDHWNYQSSDRSKEIHSVTDIPVKSRTHISLGKYDSKLDRYNIILSVPRPSFIKDQEDKKKKIDQMKDPQTISDKREFKRKIQNKEILAEVTDSGKTYRGIVRKYTGNEIKIENELGELVYNNNNFGGRPIKLFDKNGEWIENVFKTF